MFEKENSKQKKSFYLIYFRCKSHVNIEVYFRVKRSIEADGLSSFRYSSQNKVNIKIYKNFIL